MPGNLTGNPPPIHEAFRSTKRFVDGNSPEAEESGDSRDITVSANSLRWRRYTTEALYYQGRFGRFIARLLCRKTRGTGPA